MLNSAADEFLLTLTSCIFGSALVFLRFLSSSLTFPCFLFLQFPESSGVSGAWKISGIFSGVPPDALTLLFTVFLLLVFTSPISADPLLVNALLGRRSCGFLSGH